MSPENQQKLYEAFPALFRARFGSEPASITLRGIECDDGWFELIWSLSSRIEEVARSEGLDQRGDSWPEVRQVKEKFGTLRFYIFNASETIAELRNKAGEESSRICEVCGEPGTLRPEQIIKTLCSEHRRIANPN